MKLHGRKPPLTRSSHPILVSVFFIVSRDENPVFKISWILVIMTVPIFGVPFYILFGNKRIGRRVARQMAKYQEHYEKEMRAVLPEPEPAVREALGACSSYFLRQSDYIMNLTGSPAWGGTALEYFPLGEQAFARILEEVGHAKRFILFEYFIVEEGEMWAAMLAALRRKLDEGVEVRIMYDDLGSIQTLPLGYERILRGYGFKVGVFNKVKPHLNAKLNYRDHRKILIIDGHVGLPGDQLCDEYITGRSGSDTGRIPPHAEGRLRSGT